MNTTKSRAEERIDTVADLVVGDRVRVGDRTKPLDVQRVGVRTVRTRDGDTITQHLAELEGDWANATTYVVADVVNPLTGDVPGTQRFLGDGPSGNVDLRRVEGED